ncbi:MAG: DNA translocase FtsK 4TM domain-containing protein [Kiritimatiellae bacterium]|nr:DNA translocase FtsK 4TM domain-containing protein [Kiritimatiellia bacterium]
MTREEYSSTENEDEQKHRRITGWLLMPLSLFPLFALLTYDWHAIPALQTPAAPHTNWIGALGDLFAYGGYSLIGLAIWIIPPVCVILGVCIVLGRRMGGARRTLWALVFVVASSCLMQLAQSHAPGIAALKHRINIADCGGAIGYLLTDRLLSPAISDLGATMAVTIVLLVSLVGAIGAHNLLGFFRAIWLWTAAREQTAETADGDEAEIERRQEEYLAAMRAKADAKAAALAEKERVRAEKEELKRQEKERLRAEKERARAEKEAAKAERIAATAVPAPAQTVAPAQPAEKDAESGDKGPYMLPGIDLLAPRQISVADHSDVGMMSEKLVNTLKLFGIEAAVSYTVEGPVVTKYALTLAPGTRYSAVTNISDNLMGALHAKSLRIEAPIPGEECVGIEVPNTKPAGISFREIFESEAWAKANAKFELPLLFGKDAAGGELIADLASMPHMLVAGATGQGKSVCLNSLICGLLMTRTPEQLKLIMVDPKSVEFASYAAIPHLLIPVIADNNKVVKALMWAVMEMEKRLKLFTRARVRNIYDFNHRKSFTQTDMFGGDDAADPSGMPKTIPYIIIIIDEVADLMSQCAKIVTTPISRIAAKARAAGIHLILATQRPDAKVITGTIKANIPGRVAFKTASAIDSRTILDDSGAENLIGRGDMLFKGKDSVMIRAQGAWISDAEIANITRFIEEHSTLQYDDKFAKGIERVKETGVEDPFADQNDEDAKEARAEQREQIKAAANADDFKKAIECVVNTRRASTSHFQRQMGWGYNHAAKILDMLAERGVVSQQNGMGPRSILMNDDELVALLNGDSQDAAAQKSEDGEGAGELFDTQEEQPT